jgi:hypothetical protein
MNNINITYLYYNTQAIMNTPLETISLTFPGTPSGSPPNSPLGTPLGSPPIKPDTPPGSPPINPVTPPGSPIDNPDITVENIDENNVENNIYSATQDEFRYLTQKFVQNIILEYKAHKQNYSKSQYQPISELEAKFGTIRNNKSTNMESSFKPNSFITRTNYDNVIKKLRSVGFTTKSEILRLNISSELKSNGGNTYMSGTRTEIYGVSAIEHYCHTDSIDDVIRKFPQSVSNIHKYFPKLRDYEASANQKYQLDFSDFNFRVTYKMENPKPNDLVKILSTWKRNRKSFRLINRVSFVHPEYALQVDLSIVRSTQVSNKSISGSNLFAQPERYEIEIELDNQKIIDGGFSDIMIIDQFRKAIRLVLSGIQTTAYPTSYTEQSDILQQYFNIIKTCNTGHPSIDKPTAGRLPPFIGPSQYTLQTENAAEQDDNLNTINIRTNFVVTEKADGERRLCLIDNTGRMFFIDTKMNVIFSGSVTENKRFYSSILDGEYVAHNKHGDFINLYLAFDVYFIHGNSVRNNPFIHSLKQTRANLKTKTPHTNTSSNMTSRYELLNELIKEIKPRSVVSVHKKSPVRFDVKRFLPSGIEMGNNKTIFGACNTILKINKDMYEYTTDGLIFTHMIFGVGGTSLNSSSTPSNAPWLYSFKWKPADQNTVDFKVSTAKSSSGGEIVSAQSISVGGNVVEMKTIILKCSFDPRRDGYDNACGDIMNISYTNPNNNNNNNKPYVKSSTGAIDQRFFPTQPYDAKAGITHIPLKMDNSGNLQMFAKDGDMFEDGSIVEFAYEMGEDNNYRWVPLRVRHDKVRSNAYTTANNNWRSIHNPLTEEMISTGNNIPKASVSSDVYYNKVGGSFNTERMKNFHNLYVKHHLIAAAANAIDPIESGTKPEITLIDYACGKAGDLAKWTNSNISVVLGIDIAEDNLTNRFDGACARYMSVRNTQKKTPHSLFLHGNSGKNIKSGDAFEDKSHTAIAHQLFGIGELNESVGVAATSIYGIAANGFNISSCQFAMHYMFQTIDTLTGFIQNISECTALGGYFIGTAYDGSKIFNTLSKVKQGHGDRLVSSDGTKIWEVIRDYSENITNFPATSHSLGRQILVYQESINQLIPEYLVNFDYFNTLMNIYGFSMVSSHEAEQMSNGSIPSGDATFKELFERMTTPEPSQFKRNQKYKDAANMSEDEKHISFLNRIVMYKKVRHVENPNIPQDDSNQEYEIMKEVSNSVSNETNYINHISSPTINDNILSGQINETILSKFIGITAELKEDTKFVARQNAKRIQMGKK